MPGDLPEIVTRAVALSGRRIGGELSLDEVERLHILSVLERAKWNLSEASRVLGITRVTLYHKIEKYGLRTKEVPGVDAPAVDLE